MSWKRKSTRVAGDAHKIALQHVVLRFTFDVVPPAFAKSAEPNPGIVFGDVLVMAAQAIGFPPPADVHHSPRQT